MSMIRCNSCDNIGDCKDEWIDGVFEEAAPFRFWCPNCVDSGIGGNAMASALKKQDSARYHELTEFDTTEDAP